MKHRKSKSVPVFIYTLSLVFLVGCVPLATDLRESGFKEIQEGFSALKKSPNLYEIIELKHLKVHIVGDRKNFKWPKAAAYGSLIRGYATARNEIWVFGKVVNGKIVVNQAILGHELNHIINFRNPRVANPDKLDDLGA